MINKDNFNSDNYRNRLIILFETYDGHLLYQSDIQRVQTFNSLALFNKTYENDFYVYKNDLEKFGITKENFDVNKFKNLVWLSDFDLPREYNVNDITNGVDLSFEKFIINPQADQLSDLILDNYEENLIYNLINYKDIQKEVSSFRFMTESDVNQEGTKIIDLITQQEPKKQLDLIDRQLLIQKNDPVINSVLSTLPDITILTPEEIERLNNNFNHLKKEFGKFDKSKVKFDEMLEKVKSTGDDVDWKSIISQFEKLKKTNNELQSIKSKINGEIDGVSKFELDDKIKVVCDNSKKLLKNYKSK